MVWVLVGITPYEPGIFYGVFESGQDAANAKKKVIDSYSGEYASSEEYKIFEVEIGRIIDFSIC